MTRVAFLVVVTALLLTGSATAAAKPQFFTHPVHRGSVGKQVLAFKWIAAGNDPSHYRSLIHYRLPKGDQCGRRCVNVILATRWLLGEPLKYDKRCKCRPVKRPRFTREMYLMLTGRKAPPLGWIGRRNHRLAVIRALVKRRQTLAQGTPCAQALITNARRYIGVHEDPPGSNSGRFVRLFQAATTYGARGRSFFPWCMAFVNFIARQTGIRPNGTRGPPFRLTTSDFFTPGPIAFGTACVFCAFHWAQRVGWIRARPVVGAVVLYMTSQGHTGFISGVTVGGTSTIEGNTKTTTGRWGGEVAAQSFPNGYRNPVFLVFPCVQGARA